MRRKHFSGFSKKELNLFNHLNTPWKIQDFVDALPANFEENEDSCFSPKEVLRRRIAHCAEGAIFAAAALMFHGKKPLLLDLVPEHNDEAHIVALFKMRGRWGAISKTNHAVLRYREPIYKTLRELALSYFHEYFLNNGKKTLREYSRPFDVSKVRTDWLTTNDHLWNIIDALADSKHYTILTKHQIKTLRKAHPTEIEAGKITEWKKKSRAAMPRG